MYVKQKGDFFLNNDILIILVDFLCATRRAGSRSRFVKQAGAVAAKKLSGSLAMTMNILVSMPSC